MSSHMIIHSSIRKGLFAFVKTRIHISLIFLFLLLYQSNSHNSEANHPLIFSFFLWHYALFLFDRIYDREIDRISQPDEALSEQYGQKLYIIIFLLLITSFTLYLFSKQPPLFWLLLLPITFLYPLRLYKHYRIKSIFFIKNLFSAIFIYCGPLIIFGYLTSNQNYAFIEESTKFLPLFVYVLIGEVFWDIRDITSDRESGTKTIPNVLGVKATKMYILALILLDAYISHQFFSASAYIYLILLIFIKEDSPRLIFHFPPLFALMRMII